MTDLVARKDLLPGSATPRERAIAGADAAIDDLDVDRVRRAGGPTIAEVPAPYLPHRGWGASVDVWDAGWPEEIKRAVIAASPTVHAHKGTAFAVKAALGALRVDAVVSEWWQEVPRGSPYTFTVTAYASARLYDGPLLDTRLIRVIHASVMQAKPASRAFDLKVGARFPRGLGLAAAAVATVKVRRAVQPRGLISASSRLGLAPVAMARIRVAVALVPKLPPA